MGEIDVLYEDLELEQIKRCSATFILAVNDTINVISGKWKLPIISALLFGKKRFKDIEREIPKITPRMLSKELRDLEVNGIVTRTVFDTVPVSVRYELTESGKSFQKVLDVMLEWGLEHRKNVIGEKIKEQ
ncbi:helix-turn-helix domain-containing protein [uncultured Proteiniphilum sp.]|uniref:winged helix-turn-helix transcriptional regulator n=1 Tax=uncultured Proteiniphilum sp. TaxID=497637 RepID=UPI002612E074|nr:helix-turn-helix domain-containing protein [uncultured Proteiniphilum sp.]